jgi:hypothetical protein
MGSKVQGIGCRLRSWAQDLGFRIQGLGIRVQGLGLRV